MNSLSPKRATSRTGLLPNTPWTQLIRSRGGDTAANDALGHVVGLYWRPIHVCMMKRGYPSHDAEDLTQEFLAGIVQQGQFDRIDPAKGKLRSYLLTALNHFLANVWRDSRTQHRGGGAPHISLDHEDDNEPPPVLPNHQTPDVEFDREWALTVLDNVMKELSADYAQQGKQDLFEVLSPALSVSDGQTDANAMGQRIGMNAGAVRVALHRLRLRYRNMLYRHIAATVEQENQVEDEIREMIAMLRRR